MMKKYFYKFLYDEDGSQIIEWLAVLAVAAMMIGIAAKVAKTVKIKMGTAASYI